MLLNQAAAARFDDATPWDDLYEQAAEGPNNLLSDVLTAVEFGTCDPEGSLEMACAAAGAAGATVQTLSKPWSLYTPQDAASVASALFVQLRHGAGALRELERAVERIVERGEAELDVPAGAGQSADLSDALKTLRSVSDTVQDLVARHASTTVRALHAAPGSAPLPADAHETVVAVAALLADQHDGTVTLATLHEDGAYDPDDDGGFGCGCNVTLLANGDAYHFGRGDSEWSLHKESDGIEQPDGSKVFDRWESLSSTLETAHPQQLAQDVLRIVSADRD
ncbi:hypothetical protein ACODT5_18500 [Streptomyces sp. 5.8]|uniref:hypothetical protein n=1 Tax=Streptomyces sp. 5.8 TaxID=3406571 RepID=UPI003BB5C14D